MASNVSTVDMLGSNNDDDQSLQGVSLTSLYTAAVRATESNLPEDQRQFNDPYASKLAQPIMKKLIEGNMNMKEDKDHSGLTYLNFFSDSIFNFLGKTTTLFNYVRDRTVYFDNTIQKYLVKHPNCKQIVLLGSGMDTRAYRMGLSADIVVFEIDYAHVHDYKTDVLKGISIFTPFNFCPLIFYLQMTSLAVNVQLLRQIWLKTIGLLFLLRRTMKTWVSNLTSCLIALKRHSGSSKDF